MKVIETVSRGTRDAALLRRELRATMESATRGQLNYGKDLDVYACSLAELVLEMRFDQRVQFPDGVRAVRLYFSEPDSRPGVLLSALLAAKPATSAGLELQNEHIKEAQLRVETHLGL